MMFYCALKYLFENLVTNKPCDTPKDLHHQWGLLMRGTWKQNPCAFNVRLQVASGKLSDVRSWQLLA